MLVLDPLSPSHTIPTSKIRVRTVWCLSTFADCAVRNCYVNSSSENSSRPNMSERRYQYSRMSNAGQQAHKMPPCCGSQQHSMHYSINIQCRRSASVRWFLRLASSGGIDRFGMTRIEWNQISIPWLSSALENSRKSVYICSKYSTWKFGRLIFCLSKRRFEIHTETHFMFSWNMVAAQWLMAYNSGWKDFRLTINGALVLITCYLMLP